MVRREVITAKIAHAEENLSRLKIKKDMSLSEFLKNFDYQDSVLHNFQVTIQACIDIASHIVSDQGWEIPPFLPGFFDILAEHQVIEDNLAETMRQMVGFRNILVHEYETVDLKKVHHYLQNNLGDFEQYFQAIIMYLKL